MPTLAIDIGGTKYSLAVFKDGRMIRGESNATDRAGGPRWMVERIADTARAWQREVTIDRCGVGFGGPVHFREQRVYQSTHVGGWNDFNLCQELTRHLEIPVVMDNDANAGALGEGIYGAGRGSSPMFYMTDRKSTRLNSSHSQISYAVLCLKKKKENE